MTAETLDDFLNALDRYTTQVVPGRCFEEAWHCGLSGGVEAPTWVGTRFQNLADELFVTQRRLWGSGEEGLPRARDDGVQLVQDGI